MNSNTGQRAPLHRRFLVENSLRTVRERYLGLRPSIEAQVEVLQADESFLNQCVTYYSRGCKDWQICSAVYNVVLNKRLHELRLDPTNPANASRMQSFPSEIDGLIYPAAIFEPKIMERAMEMHNLTVLKTYGFELRRAEVDDQAIEEFLRFRMRHFEFDLDHAPLFGRPPGNWPV